jgi:HSP20 family protein
MTRSLGKSGNGEAYPLTFPLADWGSVDRLFDQFAPVGYRRGARVFQAPSGPVVEMMYDDKELVLRAEVPGIDRNDIELTVHDDTLTLKGVKRGATEKKDGEYHYSERQYGEFSRSFSLPFPVNTASVHATLKDGILEARLPIAEEAKPRRVEIS